MTQTKPNPMAPIESLSELQTLARTDQRYHDLACKASRNLGGRDSADLNAAIRWLETVAGETTEDGVVEEVNFCIDLVE